MMPVYANPHVKIILFFAMLILWMHEINAMAEQPLPKRIYRDQSASMSSGELPPLSTSAIIRDLFGVSTEKDEFIMKSSEIDRDDASESVLVSLWLQKSFAVESNAYHVVFFAFQSIDPVTNEPFESHADSVGVSAITYKKTSNGWTVVSRQKSPFAEVGSWGQAPEVEEADILSLGLGRISLLIPGSWSGQGYFIIGLYVLAFDGTYWEDLGYVTTGEDNSGACDEKPDPEVGLQSCWSYTGAVKVIPSQDKKYPDLLVERTGTVSGDDEYGPVEPAQNVVYEFKDGKYLGPSEL